MEKGRSSSEAEPKSLSGSSRPRHARATDWHDDSDQQRSDFAGLTGETLPQPVSGKLEGLDFENEKSYGQQGPDFPGLAEELPPPVSEKREGADLESAQSQHRNSTGQVPNFSRRTSERRSSSGPPKGQPYHTSGEAPPPIWHNPDMYATGWQTGPGDQQRPPRSPSADSSERPYSTRRPEDYMATKRPPPPRGSSRLVELYTISHLIFFSILGTLARLGVQWLTFYPGAPVVTPVIWANLGGSFLMGFLAEDRQLFRDEWTPTPQIRAEKRASVRSVRTDGSNTLAAVTTAERAKTKKTIPLYVGLATGFCGSFTSFSSFMRDVFLALSNDLPTPINHPYAAGGAITTTSAVGRNGGYSVLAILAVVLATLALSLGGLILGAHFASLLHPVGLRISSRFTRRYLDPFMVFLGLGCWLGALFLAIWPPDRPSGPASHGTWANETWRGTVLFAILFAPLGCLLRFYVSLKLNGLVSSFPLGTFAVNMFGTAMEGMLYDIQHVGVGVAGMVGGGRVGCQVLQGMQDGFCGCLTTVSTWVAEINGLRRKHAYLYALASVVAGTCLMIVIMGSVRWSVGWSSPVCVVGYTDKY